MEAPTLILVGYYEGGGVIYAGSVRAGLTVAARHYAAAVFRRAGDSIVSVQ